MTLLLAVPMAGAAGLVTANLAGGDIWFLVQPTVVVLADLAMGAVGS